MHNKGSVTNYREVGGLTNYDGVVSQVLPLQKSGVGGCCTKF